MDSESELSARYGHKSGRQFFRREFNKRVPEQSADLFLVAASHGFTVRTSCVLADCTKTQYELLDILWNVC